jgi:Short C-terminal domain
MTTQPAVSRFEGHTLVGLGASAISAVSVGGLLAIIHGIPGAVVGPLTATAAYLPAAIDYRMQSRRRNKAEDIALLQKGELRRPTALAVVMLVTGLAAVILLVDSLLGGISSLPDFDKSRGAEIGFYVVAVTIEMVVCFFIMSYASHYLGAYPYLWTAVAVVLTAGFRILLLWWFCLRSSAPPAWRVHANATLWFVIAGFYVIMLGVALVATWYGMRHHDQFLAKQLAREQSKATREATKQRESSLQSQATETQASPQDSSAPQNWAPKLVTLVNRPNDSPSAPDIHPTRNPFKEIEKLARLRDTGALTEEEFQAKKTEILRRI